MNVVMAANPVPVHGALNSESPLHVRSRDDQSFVLSTLALHVKAVLRGQGSQLIKRCLRQNTSQPRFVQSLC